MSAPPHTPPPHQWGTPAVAPVAPPRRRPWVIVAVVVGVFVVLGLLGAGLGTVTAMLTSGWDDWLVPVGSASDLVAVDLVAGDCADLGGEPTSLQPVPCAAPHDLEVYAADVTLDIGPGLGVEEAAADACEPIFADFVGAAYSRSEYDYVAFVPDAAALAAGGNVVTCAVRTMSGEQMVGSVQGSRR